MSSEVRRLQYRRYFYGSSSLGQVMLHPHGGRDNAGGERISLERS